MRRVQRAELFDYQEPEDDHRAPGVQEILPPVPQAPVAQRGEIDWEIGKFCNWEIEDPASRVLQIIQLLNYQITQSDTGA
jgi:hypothetical protein